MYVEWPSLLVADFRHHNIRSRLVPSLKHKLQLAKKKKKKCALSGNDHWHRKCVYFLKRLFNLSVRTFFPADVIFWIKQNTDILESKTYEYKTSKFAFTPPKVGGIVICLCSIEL